MDSLPPELQQTLTGLDAQLAKVSHALEPLCQRAARDADALSPLDRAKLHVALAYAINSLFYVYLKTQGVSPATHPVKNELDRIRGYVKKLKEVSAPPQRPTMRVDAAAAGRMVQHSLAASAPSAAADADESASSASSDATDTELKGHGKRERHESDKKKKKKSRKEKKAKKEKKEKKKK